MSCANPGFFLEGGRGPDGQKKQSGQRLFFLFFFLVLNLFTVYRGGPMVILQRKLYFFKDSEGVLHFPRGVQLFPGGSKCSFQ